MGKDHKICYGMRPVFEVVSKGFGVKKVLLEKGRSEDRFQAVIDICSKRGIPFEEKSGRFLTSLSGALNHQGIVAIYLPREREICFETENPHPRGNGWLCLYLDRIQDPQNFGAVVRSAEFFGVDQVFYPEYFGAPFNDLAMKASAGGGVHNPPFKIRSHSSLFAKFREKKFLIAGTSPDEGQELSEIDFQKDLVLIVGNENEGLSEKVRKECHILMKIPSFGKIESLNVSVSTGILLYQIQMQRKKGTSF